MGAHKSLSPREDSWEGFLEEVGQAEVAAVQSGKGSLSQRLIHLLGYLSFTLKQNSPKRPTSAH